MKINIIWARMLALVLVVAQFMCFMPVASAELSDGLSVEDDILIEDGEIEAEELDFVSLDEIIGDSQNALEGESVPEPDGSFLSTDDAEPTSEDTVPEVVYCEIIYDINGHGKAPQNIGAELGALLAYPGEPYVEGFVFTGWYREPECTTLWNFDEDVVIEDTTLYAGWKAIPVEDPIEETPIEEESDALAKEPEMPSGETVEENEVNTDSLPDSEPGEGEDEEVVILENVEDIEEEPVPDLSDTGLELEKDLADEGEEEPPVMLRGLKGTMGEKSGLCGTNLTWTLDDNGLLTISGTGAMTSHPWVAADVNIVSIESGVTSICDSAFEGCGALTKPRLR